MRNKNRYKIIKATILSDLCYACGLALFDYGDRVEFHLGKFTFDFLFFGGGMGWLAHINLNRTKKENELLPCALGSPRTFLFICKRKFVYGKTSTVIFY